MKTKEFLPIAQKLAQTGLFYTLKKGEHEFGQGLGVSCIGSTDRQNAKLWRRHRTLKNIVIHKGAVETNRILFKFGITKFIAKPTKSGTMSRLVEVK